MTRSLVVWGATSGAGKSWLATALCRVAARRGIDVAPFKAQDMSNNARAVARVAAGAEGLDRAIAAHAAADRPVLGVCGGLQLLGQSLHDPAGHDGERFEHRPGLGPLPLHTRFGADKRLRHAPVRFAAPQGVWSALAGVQVPGDEIRCGQTTASPDNAVLHDAQGQAIGWQQGSVFGVYAHGLFEQPAVLQALFGATVPTLEQACETLADIVEQNLSAALLRRLLGQ